MFRFSSDADQDVYKTLGSLVKFNNGFFKSAKQSNFVLSEKFSWAWVRPSEVKTDEERAQYERNSVGYFNIPVDARVNTVYHVSATTQWAEYGRRSVRRVAWVFVCDRFGVVAQYKLRFIYANDGASSSVDPTKTELLWSRPADAVMPSLFEEEEKRIAAAVAANANKTFIGKVGERIELTAKIVSVKQFEGQSFSYYDSGVRTMTVLEDADGNRLMYWNALGSKGETVRFKATVKAHQEYKGVKQTVLSRAKVLESLGGGEDQMADDSVEMAA